MIRLIRDWIQKLQWVKTARGKWHLVECLNYPAPKKFIPICLPPEVSYRYVNGPTYGKLPEDAVICKMCAAQYKKITGDDKR